MITPRNIAGFGESIKIIDNPGKRVSNARNLALEHIGKDITHCLEIIGHSWVDKDHVEKRVNDLIELESSLGIRVGAIGCLTKSGSTPGMVSNWIEGALSSPIGSGGGQFKQFIGRNETKVPAFCLHNVEALRSVGGWDERFITSQDSDLSMRLLRNGWSLWRSDVSCVYMHKRSTIGKWWKMCHRYGFWRTKVVLSHPTRLDRENCYQSWIDSRVPLPEWWYAPAAYFSTLLLVGFIYRPKNSGFTPILGIPLCLIILHTAFTIGLFDGFTEVEDLLVTVHNAQTFIGER